MIDHLWVSWIQIVGLLISLYGLLLLSLTFFGQSGPVLLRPLVPTAVVIVLFIVVASIGVSLETAWRLPLAAYDVNNSFFLLLGSIVVGALYYALSLDMISGKRHVNVRRLLRRTLAAFIIGLAGFVAVGLLTKRDNLFLTFVVIFVVGFGGIILLEFLYLLTLERTRRVDSDGLQRLGLILSIAGILTQFLPPVLDILSIKITNP